MVEHQEQAVQQAVLAEHLRRLMELQVHLVREVLEGLPVELLLRLMELLGQLKEALEVVQGRSRLVATAHQELEAKEVLEVVLHLVLMELRQPEVK